ncbi:MAG: winged helix-turn-helix domain-containing protein [Nanobdellota archaeon]
MSKNKEVLESLISPSTLKILKLFINNDDTKYYLREISKLSKVPPATTYRVLQQLVENDLLIIDQIKRMKLYYLNTENTQFLLELLQDRKSAVTEFVNTVKSFEGVQMVVLHGKEEKNRANVLVIGNNLDSESIKRNAVYMSDKYNFNIILLTLTPDQYNQMSSMGLYPGKKRILFEAEN